MQKYILKKYKYILKKYIFSCDFSEILRKHFHFHMPSKILSNI